MTKISTSIIAFNQADKIEDCIASALWTDEIVLADFEQQRRTAQIAERMGARVVQIPITTFSELRNRAADACTGEWISSLDSDERCTPALRDEILALLAAGPKYDAYYIRGEIFHGPLDQRFRLVPKLPSAAILSQGNDALHADHSRGRRHAEQTAYRKA